MDNVVTISHCNYWIKVVGMLQQNWALVEINQEHANYDVFFITDASGVFDSMPFPTEKEAVRALRKNGFSLFSENENARNFIAPPLPPFTQAKHPNGRIYSSGKFWK